MVSSNDDDDDDDAVVARPATRRRRTRGASNGGTQTAVKRQRSGDSTPPRRSRRNSSSADPSTRAAKQQTPNYKDDTSHDSSTSSEPESEVEEAKPKTSAKKGRGPASERTCPHCNKVFSIKTGLDYHLQKKVCQQPKKAKATKRKRVKVESDQEDDAEENSDEEIAERPKRKRKGRERGPASERTCPKCKRVFAIKEGLDYHVKQKVCERNPPQLGATKKKGKHVCEQCNRVFTVAFGLQYHVKHKVCLREKNTSSSLGTAASFETLDAGSKFVTPYGVVEVVADNRETPLEYTMPDNIKTLIKKRSTAKSKRESRKKKRLVTVAIKNRVRRHRLMQLYKNGDMSQGEVWNACFGGDPTTMERPKRASPEPPEEEEDPLVPKTSYPDRIVECILIPDERRVVDSTTDEKEAQVQTRAPCGMRLYLQRRLLTQPYNAEVPAYTCRDCGVQLNSKDGFTYHVQGEVCTKRAKIRDEQSRERLQIIEEGMHLKLKEGIKPKRVKKRQEANGIPNQVMEELGYRGVLPEAQGSAEQDEKDKFDIGPDLKNPDEELNRLQGELEKAEAILAIPRPVLPGKKSKKKKKRRRRKKKAEVANPPEELPPAKLPPCKPPPPIIDTVVLIDEADAGRYPSMKRYDGDHLETCVLCKKNDGSLCCCNFCSNAEHIECMRTKFTVKEPEPEEDFMCHKCVGYLLTMRSRAEKRRLQKLGPVATATATQDLEDNEYYVMARKARQVSELMELLQDAKTRLKDAVNVSKVNNVRRSMM